jgi:hypothetical protein
MQISTLLVVAVMMAFVASSFAKRRQPSKRLVSKSHSSAASHSSSRSFDFGNVQTWHKASGDQYSMGLPDYGLQYKGGYGTYYGTPPMPGNSDVHCHLPNNMFGLTTIAINHQQYDGSKACGMCVRVFAPGTVCPNGNDPGDGSCGMGGNPITGTFDAVVTDELVERHRPDIDLGRAGDGKWAVTWMPIPCPEAAPKLTLHQGSNPYYAKIQMRLLDGPMAWMEMNGHRSPERYTDNHYVFQNMGPFQFDSNDEISVKVKTVRGTTYCGKFDRQFKGQPYEYDAWKC